MEPGGSMPHSQGLSNNSYPVFKLIHLKYKFLLNQQHITDIYIFARGKHFAVSTFEIVKYFKYKTDCNFGFLNNTIFTCLNYVYFLVTGKLLI
jgi:hypothetical protein